MLTPCKPCPSFYGVMNGTDPEAYDFLNDYEYCIDKSDPGLWCPWEKRRCPMHQRNRKTAAKCHAAGKPIPFRIHEKWVKYGKNWINRTSKELNRNES